MRGPLLLQKLPGTAFTTMKYLAKDPTWMNAEVNSETLLATMDQEENFGEDCDEDLLSSLAKVRCTFAGTRTRATLPSSRDRTLP